MLITQENKNLLLKDLCARVPYGVKCAIFDDTLPFGGAHGGDFKMDGITIEEIGIDVWLEKGSFNFDTIKPYLRPMSSMTEEEVKEYKKTCEYSENDEFFYPTFKTCDWLNAHYFDYRGLIGKGLALKAPEGMYKTE